MLSDILLESYMPFEGSCQKQEANIADQIFIQPGDPLKLNHVHPCESKIAPSLNFYAYFFKVYSVIFLIFTYQTGARILILNIFRLFEKKAKRYRYSVRGAILDSHDRTIEYFD